MIVTCERCATQFQLDDSRVPARGVRVRCSRCKNAFRVVPESQRAAEQIAELARRAREDSQEEITQDLEDSRSRAAARRAERPGAPARGEAAAAAGAPEAEESDWKFNEDVSGEHPHARAGREEPKPELPAARRGQNADDWFSGGGDTPLELDDRRPWEASEPEPEPEPEPEERTPQTQPSAPAPPPAAVAPPPAAVAVSVATAPERRPDLDALPPASEAADLFSALSEPEPEEKPEADRSELFAQPADASSTQDELSGENWDQVFGEALEADASEPAKPKKQRRARGPRIALPSLAGVFGRVGRAIAYGGHAFGWAGVLALFGAGLYAGLAPAAPVKPAEAERVGGLELAALEGRFVENAVSGRLFVVSGHVRNPGPGSGALQDLEVELLDAAGQPLAADRAALHAPTPKVRLREEPAPSLTGPQPLAAVRAGEERAFEAVFARLPDEAVAFRIAPSHAERDTGGPLPDVDLPR